MRLLATILFLIVNFLTWAALMDLNLRLDGIGVFLAIVLLSFVAVLVHELGHALAVRLEGGRVETIMVIPFELGLRPWRFGMATSTGRGDLGGYVAYDLGEGETARAHATIAAAGPAANFVLAVIALLVALCLPAIAASMLDIHPLVIGPGDAPLGGGMLPSDADLLSAFNRTSWFHRARTMADLAKAFAIVSTGMGVANLVPFDGSDGDAIRRELWPKWRG